MARILALQALEADPTETAICFSVSWSGYSILTE